MPFHTDYWEKIGWLYFIYTASIQLWHFNFEPIAKSIAKDNFKVVQSQFTSEV